jgi:lipopolysaccharide export system permease protein
MLYDIMIYDHRYDKGNETVTVADSGTMKITSDKRYMILDLYSGETHEEITSENREVRTYPYRTDKFKKQTLYSKLQGMELERKDESIFRNQFKALNNKQLAYFTDSISKQVEKSSTEQSLSLAYPQPISMSLSAAIHKGDFPMPSMRLHKYVDIDSVMQYSLLPARKQLIESALNSARNNIRSLKLADDMNTANVRMLNRFDTEWHKKYTYSIACLIFFFIGAPLGAIIRKGGLGTPLVVSVMLFIFYWVTSTTGEKFVREVASGMWIGVWFSTFIFLPAGVFLTYKAVTDSTVLSIDSYREFFKKLRFWDRKRTEDLS